MKQKVVNIKFGLLCLIAFMLPFYIFLTPLCIVLYAVAWVIEGNYVFKFTSFIQNKYALLFFGMYVVYALGLIYAPDLQSGLFNMQLKLSIGLFPLLLVSEDELNIKKQRLFMRAFILGCVLKGLTCLGYAAGVYFTTGVSQFTYMQFSIHLHPSYYTMYIDIALLFIYYMATSGKMNIIKKEKITLLCVAAFLLLLIGLLESKTGWICTFILIIALLINMYLNKKYRKFSLAVLLILITGWTLAYRTFFKNSASRFNMLHTLVSSGKMDSTSGESTQARYFAWKAAEQLIVANPMIGYGTGQAWQKLQEQYEKDNYTGPLIHKINSHNQYLQTTIDIGIIGLLYLLACLILPLIKAIKEKRFIYGMFICIFLINILVESMLEQQAGTMFYGFFNSLLMFNFVI